MTIWPGHIAVLNHFNGTDIDHTLGAFEWGDTVVELIDKGMLIADPKNKTYHLTDQGRSLLRILKENWEKEQAARTFKAEVKRQTIQPRIDVIIELVSNMDADERLMVFSEMDRKFCRISGANR